MPELMEMNQNLMIEAKTLVDSFKEQKQTLAELKEIIKKRIDLNESEKLMFIDTATNYWKYGNQN